MNPSPLTSQAAALTSWLLGASYFFVTLVLLLDYCGVLFLRNKHSGIIISYLTQPMLCFWSYVLWAPPKGYLWTRKSNFTSCYNRELRDSVLCLLHRQSIIVTCHNVTEGNIERNKNWPVRMGDLFSPLPESNYEKTAWVIFSWKKLKLSFQLWPYFFAVCDNIVCCC